MEDHLLINAPRVADARVVIHHRTLFDFEPLATVIKVVSLVMRRCLIHSNVRVLLLIDQVNAHIDKLLVGSAVQLVAHEEVVLLLLMDLLLLHLVFLCHHYMLSHHPQRG